MKDIADLTGRLFLSFYFLEKAFRMSFCFKVTADNLAEHGLSLFTKPFLALIILMILGGSSLVLTGYRSKTGACVLLILLIGATIIFNLNFSEPLQRMHISKNMAIAGGLLVLCANGSGKYSIRKLFASTRT